MNMEINPKLPWNGVCVWVFFFFFFFLGGGGRFKKKTTEQLLAQSISRTIFSAVRDISSTNFIYSIIRTKKTTNKQQNTAFSMNLTLLQKKYMPFYEMHSYNRKLKINVYSLVILKTKIIKDRSFLHIAFAAM